MYCGSHVSHKALHIRIAWIALVWLLKLTGMWDTVWSQTSASTFPNTGKAYETWEYATFWFTGVIKNLFSLLMKGRWIKKGTIKKLDKLMEEKGYCTLSLLFFYMFCFFNLQKGGNPCYCMQLFNGWTEGRVVYRPFHYIWTDCQLASGNYCLSSADTDS